MVAWFNKKKAKPMTKMDEGLKTESQARARAKAEKGLKVERKERQGLDAQPAETIKVFKLIHRHHFHLKTAKRKFALLSALAILSVIALTKSRWNNSLNPRC